MTVADDLYKGGRGKRKLPKKPTKQKMYFILAGSRLGEGRHHPKTIAYINRRLCNICANPWPLHKGLRKQPHSPVDTATIHRLRSLSSAEWGCGQSFPFFRLCYDFLPNMLHEHFVVRSIRKSMPVFLNRRAAARYRVLASIIPGRERFPWNLSF